MVTKIVKGYINKEDDVLKVDDPRQLVDSEPIVKAFDEKLSNKKVSIRYWIASEETTPNQLKEDVIKALAGAIDSKYVPHYSEITGYLWTDEKLNVGGHNIVNELENNIGMYIYMEIDIHE